MSNKNSSGLKTSAKKAISLLDLTNLNDECSKEDISQLCKRAQTPFGSVAAICIWPQFIEHAAQCLKGKDIQIATVVNFPKGESNIASVETETRKAVDAGVDEVDLVFPYNAFLKGEENTAADMILAIRQICLAPVRLKVIIESGELKDPVLIKKASFLAIKQGADFIKTSTGKVEENATLKSARIMLEAIRKSGEPVGFKPAGGIKTSEDAKAYIDLAIEIMGEAWITNSNLRFGASSVLVNLLATLNDEASTETSDY